MFDSRSLQFGGLSIVASLAVPFLMAIDPAGLEANAVRERDTDFLARSGPHLAAPETLVVSDTVAVQPDRENTCAVRTSHVRHK